MNCVAKRAPVAGAQVLQPARQTTNFTGRSDPPETCHKQASRAGGEQTSRKQAPGQLSEGPRRNSLESVQSVQSRESSKSGKSGGPLARLVGPAATRSEAETGWELANNWQTIPLEETRRPAAAKQAALQKPALANRRPTPAATYQSERLKRRLDSLVASCKTLASHNESKPAAASEDAANASAIVSATSAAAPLKGRPVVGAQADCPSPGGPPDSLILRASEKPRNGSARASNGGGPPPASKSLGPQAARPLQIGKQRAPFLFAGILASILGSVFFSMGMLCIKLLPDGHGLAEKTKIVCFRGCVMALLCGATISYQNSTFKVKRDELWVNALRALFGFTGVYGAYISLKYISMGDSTALVFSSPVWTSLLSHFILNEPLQWVQLLALPASLAGIILIAHPALLVDMDQMAGATERQPLLEALEAAAAAADGDEADLLVPSLAAESSASANASATFNALANVTGQALLNNDLDIAVNTREHFDFEHRWKGIAIALATSLIVSSVYIVLKFRKSTPIQTTTFWLGLTTVVASLALMPFTGLGELPRSAGEWSLLALNGLCSWLGQVLLQWALAYEDASVLSVIRTLDVAMTFTLSALFLDEQILWTSVLGAAIIALVVLSIMLNSWLARKLCPSPPGGAPHADSSANDRHQQQAQWSEGELEAPSTDQSRLASPMQLRSPVMADHCKPRAGAHQLTLKLEAPREGA